jgi:hypothetical protein
MKLVFCGTPQFAVPTLLALIDAGHEIALVLTQPDRPSGRGMQLFAPPVKQMAEAAGLDILQPEKIKNNLELRERLTGVAPDAILVVARFCRMTCWRARRWAALTSTPRCCRSIAGPRRSSGRSRAVKRSPE